MFDRTPIRLPDTAKGLVDGIWLRRKVLVEMIVAPPTHEDRSDRLAIVVGSSSRNSFRRDYVTRGLPAALLAVETPSGKDLRSNEVREVLVGTSGGDEQVIKSTQGVAIVERFNVPDSSRLIFFCAGARGDTTRGAVEYLIRHWKDLQREFGSRPFVVCLGFPLPEYYPTDYIEPTVIARIRL